MRKQVIRIIIVGGLGDVLLLTPSLKALKQLEPHSKIIVFFPSKDSKKLLANNPYLDRAKLARRAHWNGLLHRLGWRKFHYVWHAQLVPNLLYRKSAAYVTAEMLDLELEDKSLEIYLKEKEERRGEEIASQFKRPVVVLNPTSSSSQNHEWALESWEQVIERLPGLTFVQVGLPAEPAIAGAVDCRGTPLRDSIAFLKHADCYAGVDTFWAHAAAAVGTPGVVLFGDSHPAVYGHESNLNIYKGLRCSPCQPILLGNPCPYTKKCMTSISVDEVVEAVSRQAKASLEADLAQLPARHFPVDRL